MFFRQRIKMTTFAELLNGTCWNTLMSGVYQTVSFQLVPTFYHDGGIFLLQYFDQCDRDGPQIVYQDTEDGIVMKIMLDEPYMALYSGSKSLTWKSQSGKTLVWSQTICWPSKIGIPSTPLVGQ
jgi:hypothetical protein